MSEEKMRVKNIFYVNAIEKNNIVEFLEDQNFLERLFVFLAALADAMGDFKNLNNLTGQEEEAVSEDKRDFVIMAAEVCRRIRDKAREERMRRTSERVFE
jgi:hypothetical protein